MSEALAESMHQLVDSNKATQDILTKLVSIMGERESAQINKTDKLLSLMETLVGALTPKKGEVVESVKEEKETPEIKVDQLGKKEEDNFSDEGLANIRDAFKYKTPAEEGKKGKKSIVEPRTLEAKLMANIECNTDPTISKQLGYKALYKDRDTLEPREPFKIKEKLPYDLKMLQLLDMVKSMNLHYSAYTQRVYFRQTMDEQLQLLIAARFLGNSLQQLNELSEEQIYACLITIAAPRTKDQFVHMLKQYEATEQFARASLRIGDFYHIQVPNIMLHVKGFVDYFDALKANDETLVPDIFRNQKNDGGGVDRECVVQIFINSFPPKMGNIFSKFFEIKDKKTFNKYIDDFMDKVNYHAGLAREVEPLNEALNELYKVRKGNSLKESTEFHTKKLRFNELIIPADPISVPTKILKHEQNMSDLHYLNQRPAPKPTQKFEQRPVNKDRNTSEMGCFDVAHGKVCSKGSSCPYSHKKEHIKIAQQKLLERAQYEIENIKKAAAQSNLHVLQDSDQDYDTAPEDDNFTSKKTISEMGTNSFYSDSEYGSDNDYGIS